MSIYNIKTDTKYNLSKAIWDTGNKRSSLQCKPLLGLSNFIDCIYDVSDIGTIISLRPCRTKTLAEHGSQPSVNLSIGNMIIPKN